ncbi:hypothetical protein KJY73_12580 [Bowmanella sp. Y26]|uniref:hypothetical protein n=1 Tax=Bowmanella yangjiangensis TaxID=2811230 RepID=UPI001BDD06FC|nr:hypothetical protein [Bowmanella yangjiangensis]MBT1064418.1 hypothetical protein [Bowmanella yangjiangensis]
MTLLAEWLVAKSTRRYQIASRRYQRLSGRRQQQTTMCRWQLRCVSRHPLGLMLGAGCTVLAWRNRRVRALMKLYINRKLLSWLGGAGTEST